MNQRLFLAMSRRRVSSPLTVQQIWDAVKIIRYKKQVVNEERIAHYMKTVHSVSEDEVRRQLHHCVRDGLLKVTKKAFSKGKNIGQHQDIYRIPEEKLVKDTHDWYCFECHSGGDVISCTSCHRVYHLSCLSDDLPDTDIKTKFICNVCVRCDIKEATPNIKKSQLNRLLKYTASKLKERLPIPLTDRQVSSNKSYISERFASQGQVKRPSIDVPSNFKWILDEKDEWRVDYLIHNPVNLQAMEIKAENNRYEHLEEFKADVQTIVHNVVIFHGVNSNMADMARLMLRDCNNDIQEMLRCCHCYKYSNDKTLRNWFCKPCKPPHELVYARQDGGPYWPAKVMKIDGEEYDVRLFGGSHERAVVNKSFIRPISVNIHALQVKSNSNWNKACEELKRHQKQLEKLKIETKNFTLPFTHSTSESSDSDSDEYDTPIINRFKNKATLFDNDKLKSKRKVSDDEDDDEEEEEEDDDDDEDEKENNAKKRESIKPPVLKEIPLFDDEEDDAITSRLALVEKQRRQRLRKRKILSDKEEHKKSKMEKKKLPSLKMEGSSSLKLQKSKSSSKESRKKSEKGKKRSHVVSPPSSPSDDTLNSETVSETDVGPPKLEITELAPNMLLRPEIGESSISSTSGHKRHDEEVPVVSSSSHNPTKRSVKVQTKLLGRDWMLRDDAEKEKTELVAKLQKEHESAIAKLQANHRLHISETKRKQWCVSCELEAIYHCCWNTSYCSPKCQLDHWATDHKRHCRRKR